MRYFKRPANHPSDSVPGKIQGIHHLTEDEECTVGEALTSSETLKKRNDHQRRCSRTRLQMAMQMIEFPKDRWPGGFPE